MSQRQGVSHHFSFYLNSLQSTIGESWRLARNRILKFSNRFREEGLPLETLVSDYCKMEQKHRTILRHYWNDIRDNLEPKNILPKLVLVLKEKDEEEIKAQSTRQGRCDKLLEILPTKGKKAFNIFVNALVKEAPDLEQELTQAGNKEESNLINYRLSGDRSIS